ncbi:MAG: hypothetical protein CM15mP74_37250 [Halieaceae bacterium]|nr:MAG: hypothetical protein CM15mP74_37250 [Halieaceae bacterium]
MGEEVLASLFSQGAGEMFDLTELSTSNARIPLHGRVPLTASQRQGIGPIRLRCRPDPALPSSPLERHRRRRGTVCRLELVARGSLG